MKVLRNHVSQAFKANSICLVLQTMFQVDEIILGSRFIASQSSLMQKVMWKIVPRMFFAT